MNKDDVIDIILKAAAIYLLVLAVIALPGVIGELMKNTLLAHSTLKTLSVNPNIGQRIMSTGISASTSGIIKFVLYLLVARNLFSGGSWFKWILSKKEATRNNENI